MLKCEPQTLPFLSLQGVHQPTPGQAHDLPHVQGAGFEARAERCGDAGGRGQCRHGSGPRCGGGHRWLWCVVAGRVVLLL